VLNETVKITLAKKSTKAQANEVEGWNQEKALNFNFGMWKIYFILDFDSFSKFLK
jgi:hypothetical protein